MRNTVLPRLIRGCFWLLPALTCGGALGAAAAPSPARPVASPAAPSAEQIVAEQPAATSVEQIVAKNTAARGGLDKWRNIASMTVYEHTQSEMPGSGSVAMVIRMKRPSMRRVDTQAGDGFAAEVFDGRRGWKARVSRAHGTKVEPFTGAETSRAAIHADLDSPLIDYAAKGNTVELEGSEPIEGRPAWRLKLTQQGQYIRHVWIDAQSFLEVKIEEFPRIVNNQIHPVNTYYSDYRSVDGLLMPFKIDTRVEGTGVAERTVVDRVGLNSQIENGLFVKPGHGLARAGGLGQSAAGIPPQLLP